MQKWAGGYFYTKNVQFENVNFFIKFSRAANPSWPFLTLQNQEGLPTLPDSAEDFLIFRENKPIWVHKFDNLPDSGNFLSIKLHVI